MYIYIYYLYIYTVYICYVYLCCLVRTLQLHSGVFRANTRTLSASSARYREGEPFVKSCFCSCGNGSKLIIDLLRVLSYPSIPKVGSSRSVVRGVCRCRGVKQRLFPKIEPYLQIGSKQWNYPLVN